MRPARSAAAAWAVGTLTRWRPGWLEEGLRAASGRQASSSSSSTAAPLPDATAGGHDEEDTIVALASGPGPSAIAVIRVAGPSTDALLGALCGWRTAPPPRTARLVRVRDPTSGATLDPAALALRFPGPASYTGGPCGELHVHGGPAVVDAVLRAATSPRTARLLNGVLRLAGPGEFTRRAVEAGKLDVASAEGVADLTTAVTEAARAAALPLATGEASAAFEAWRAAALGLLARTEACLEWEDDPGGADLEGGRGAPASLASQPLGTVAMAAVAVDAAALAAALEASMAAGARAEIAAAGARAALVGPPNAGKSSLLNALARRPAAIVAPSPGTTRDVVEVSLDVGGWGVVLADTAGLREDEGVSSSSSSSSSSPPVLCPAEAEGIARARAAAAGADVRVAVVDAGVVAAELGASAPSSSSPSLARAAALLEGLAAASSSPPPPALLVLNKWDLVSEEGEGGGAAGRAAVHAAATAAAATSPTPPSIIPCSASTGEGLPALAAALASSAAAAAGASTSPSPLLPGTALAPGDASARALPVARARHRGLVSSAAASLRRAAALVEAATASGRPPPTELVAEEVREAVDALGGLRAGRSVGTEEVLGEVFERFCVGK